jgi:hypothetical protein
MQVVGNAKKTVVESNYLDHCQIPVGLDPFREVDQSQRDLLNI